MFGNEEITQRFRLPAGAAEGQAVSWHATLETAVIARRDALPQADANRGPLLTVQFKLPEGEPRAILPISVFVTHRGEEVLAKKLWVFPRNPFSQPIPLQPDSEMVLFDPKRTTVGRFEQAKIAFRSERNIENLADIERGVLIVGEGVSFREYRGLPDLLIQAATRGVKVVCLAPSAGGLVLPGDVQEQAPALRGFSLKRTEIITDFDKRLDDRDWRGKTSLVGSVVQLNGKGNSLTADIQPAEHGWPWLEAEFSGGGRLIVCGFRIIEQWESSPAPRYVLWHLLAHAVREPAVAVPPEVRR